MNTTKKATGKLYHTLWQVVHQIPRWNIEKLANKYGIDARKFSQTSHVVMLLLGHLTHARCLTEICDNASVHRAKLHLVRRATPAPRNTFSHANRTRDAALAEELYWSTLDDMRRRSPGFAPLKPRAGGYLARLRNREITAADSTVISLALNCVAAFPYKAKKAAAKAHMRINVGSFLPSVVVVTDGKTSDMSRSDALCEGLKSGDIFIIDRGYVDFAFFRTLEERSIFWITRQRGNMCYDVEAKREVKGDIVSDETVRLKLKNTAEKYPGTFRRVEAYVEIDGKKKCMVFITNNMTWSARMICELYKSRWTIEIFFKELKQTLQLTDFIGTNENAVKWQIWTGLLLHLILHYLKFLSGWNKSFSRLAGLAKSTVWVECDIVEILKIYGMAGPPQRPQCIMKQAYFEGFEPNTSNPVGWQKLANTNSNG